MLKHLKNNRKALAKEEMHIYIGFKYRIKDLDSNTQLQYRDVQQL